MKRWNGGTVERWNGVGANTRLARDGQGESGRMDTSTNRRCDRVQGLANLGGAASDPADTRIIRSRGERRARQRGDWCGPRQ